MIDEFENKYRTWHTYMSSVKSAIRIIAFGALALSVVDSKTTAVLLLIAELVGIAEEWV